MKIQHKLYTIIEFIVIFALLIIPPITQKFDFSNEILLFSINVTSIITRLCISCFLLFLLFLSERYTKKELLHSFSRKSLRISLLSFILIIYISFIFNKISIFYDTNKLSIPNTLTTKEIILFVFQLIIYACFEEVLYRKYLYTRIKQFFSNTKFITILSVIICSILFALGHLYSGLLTVTFSFICGLIFSLVYIKTNNILYSCIPHILYNLFVFIQQTRQLQ